MTQQGIEVFLAVARLGSISAAAQALYITQPAVSRHLRTLEETLGCVLVHRGPGQRRAELTEQGRDFVRVAEKWRLLWQEAREVAGQDRTQVLRAASVGSLVSDLLPPVFRDFLAPGRALTFHSYHSREAYDYVAQGLTDIALISDHMYHPQVETVPAFCYIKYAVISADPEGDAIGRVRSIARSCGVETPRVIGWDFPNVSQEQINVYNMHGYEAAWILPDGVVPPDIEVHEQEDHLYAAIHVEDPFGNPFVTIPNAYKTLMEYMRVNGLEHTENGVIPCFETDGESMDIYIACK